MRQKLLALATVAALLPLAQARAQSMVQSQEGIALQNEIDQLQSQLQQLQANGGNGSSALAGSSSPPPASSGGGSQDQGGMVANLLTQVQQLQQQVQDLSGKVDELQNQVNTQHDATEKEIGDLKFQMGSGGGAGAAAGAAAAGAAPTLAAPAQSSAPVAPAPQAAASANPREALKAAEAAYTKHDYATAQSLAQGIVTQNKQAPEAYRAQYLVAQSLSAQGKAQSAAIAFDSTYNMNRSGTYAPQSLLGLASSLSAIGQTEAACDTIASLNSQFPTPPAGMQPRIDAVSKRAHCQ
ncbi:tetratricopeptide repeat protein [Acidocella aromatica]|uniref:TolA-binding protein n=1 Tax=Acidocella aromatica TaxID=1303579 RepID=A0A840VA50_9PROT|nr:hypothetical protein [Acidocella aromatica]MBB5372643.1 TolA-binding protein [Acidocella aromatica]